MLRILAVRHGQTEWNLSGRNQGHADIPLDATGMAQAEDLAAALREEEFDAIYCSPMQRAIQTLPHLRPRVGLEPILDDRLKERNYGLWEGVTQDDAKRTHPELFETYHADPTVLSPPEGESGIDVFCRVGYFVHDLLAKHSRGNVLVVSHGGTLSAFLAVMIGGMPSTANTFRIRNCSISEVRVFSNGRRRLVRFDDTSHLSASPIDAYSGVSVAGR